jgi:hypothetical protein
MAGRYPPQSRDHPSSGASDGDLIVLLDDLNPQTRSDVIPRKAAEPSLAPMRTGAAHLHSEDMVGKSIEVREGNLDDLPAWHRPAHNLSSGPHVESG